MTSWPTPLRFLERLFSFVAFTSQTARATAPASPAGAGALSTCSPPPGLSTSTAGTDALHGPSRRDLGGIGDHLGSPDLNLWPPSLAELEMAREEDHEGLWAAAQSIPRMKAIIREVDLERRAARAFGVEPS